MFFFESHTENEGRSLVLDLFLFLKKALYEVKASGLGLVSISLDGPQLGYDINKLSKL